MNRPLGTSPRRKAEGPAMPPPGEDDPRLVAALEDYLGRTEEGQAPDRNLFLAEYPEIADELADCIDGLQFIQTAASRISSDAPPNDFDHTPPTQLGDYRILREVGRGGMGIVYEAQQVSLGRRVALKVLPFAASIDPRQRQRFQVEAQAAAHLHHPHIVPIYSVGNDRGVHFYAMQFIEGHTLSDVVRGLCPAGSRSAWPEWGDKWEGSPFPSTVAFGEGAVEEKAPHGSGEMPVAAPIPQRGRGLFRTIARLGSQAAEALEHAHGLGVLHRDIKPSNLIVDLRGNLWITDFGLARFEEDIGLTRTGDLLGTLRYMSPEQAQAMRVVVDHRTDVYSLGATLYEVLTLRPVFDGRDRNELLKQIAVDEPVAPRKVDASIPRDLETIVIKAMAKEPQGRYATAQEMADDLRRFLADEPILARRPSLLERMGRWARRHRTAVVVAAILLVVALVIAAGLLWRDRSRTQTHLDEVMGYRKRERESLLMTLDAADQLTSGVMGMLSQRGGADPELHQLYMMSIRFYERVEHDSGDDPEMRGTKAKALENIGQFRWRFGQRDLSIQAYEQAIGLFQAEADKSPGDFKANMALARALKGMGAVQADAGDVKRAEPYFLRSIEISRGIAERLKDEPAMLRNLLETEYDWANRLEVAGRKADAEPVRREIYSHFAAMAERCRANPALRKETITTYFALATDLENRAYGDSRWRAQAAEIYEQTLILDPKDPHVYNNIAWFFAKHVDSSPAEKSRAVELAKKASELAPSESALWNTLGAAYYRAGSWAKAKMALENSMKVSQSKEGDPFDWFFMAMTLYRSGQRAEAMKWYARALGSFEGPILRIHDIHDVRREADELLGDAPEKPPAAAQRRAVSPARRVPATPPSAPAPARPAVAPAAAGAVFRPQAELNSPMIKPILPPWRRGPEGWAWSVDR